MEIHRASAIGGALMGALAVAAATLILDVRAVDEPTWGTDFSPVSPNVGAAPLRVAIEDRSYDNSSETATVNAWEWDFGDGTSSRCQGSQCQGTYWPVPEFDQGVFDVRLESGGTHQGVVQRRAFVVAFPASEPAGSVSGMSWIPGEALLVTHGSTTDALVQDLRSLRATWVRVWRGDHVDRFNLERDEQALREALGESVPPLLWIHVTFRLD